LRISSMLRMAAPKRLMRFAEFCQIFSTVSSSERTASPMAMASLIGANATSLNVSISAGYPLRFAEMNWAALVEPTWPELSAVPPGRYTP